MAAPSARQEIRGSPRGVHGPHWLYRLRPAGDLVEERRISEGRPAVLFAGEFEGHVDSRGRIAVPAAFTEALSGVVVVARGFERCVSIYSADGWQRIAAEIGELPATDAESRRLARFIFASANEQQPDGQGRIELPAALRKYAGIDRDVAVIGTGGSVEIWDRETWAAELADLQERLLDSSNPGDQDGNEQAAA